MINNKYQSLIMSCTTHLEVAACDGRMISKWGSRLVGLPSGRSMHFGLKIPSSRRSSVEKKILRGISEKSFTRGARPPRGRVSGDMELMAFNITNTFYPKITALVLNEEEVVPG